MLFWIDWREGPPGRLRFQSPVLKQDWDTKGVIKLRGYALSIPTDSRQTEYLLGDGGHAKVRITVRRAPITGKSALSGVVDHLKGPTQLGNDVGIGQGGHVRMGPRMHRDIILVGLEGR